MSSLPLVPGYTFHDPMKAKYHRPQTLDYKNGYAVKGVPSVGIGGERLPEVHRSEESLERDLQATGVMLTYGPSKKVKDSTYIPAHVALDKKTLRFDAYFREAVQESPDETFRIRKVKIYYYLEDDSIQVVEPVVENSGIPQGVLLKRQRLPRNNLGECYSYEDLNLGIGVRFYGKIFHIVDCDGFTREFMAKSGIDLNPPSEFPEDPYGLLRSKPTRVHTHTQKDDKLKKFLENDRKVLRFYAIWDDRISMFGERRPFVLHYFLVDDTVEVREVHTPNDGRDAFPTLLKRQRLPKQQTDKSILADIGEHYTPEDLGIGRVVSVFNRQFLLYDCDKYTRSYLEDQFGPQPASLAVDDEHKPQTKRTFPPYNGFGSEEDSLGCCVSLVPKPPMKDFVKMIDNEHKILRFAATLRSDKPEDKGRNFIVSYRLADDMITIYEPPQRNAGILGGKFLERTRVLKPGHDRNNPAYYGPADLWIGGVIVVFNHSFHLTDADEYCLRYLEDHPDQFPHANVHAVETKLVGASPAAFVGALGRIDGGRTGRVPRKSFAYAVSEAFADKISLHEGATLARYYDLEKTNEVLYPEFLRNVFNL
eukprot:Opistho-2@685